MKTNPKPTGTAHNIIYTGFLECLYKPDVIILEVVLVGSISVSFFL